MPTGFYYPEKIMEFDGVSFYAVYNNDHQHEGRHPYFIGTSIHASAEGYDVIDVRTLPTYEAGLPAQEVLAQALRHGYTVHNATLSLAVASA